MIWISGMFLIGLGIAILFWGYSLFRIWFAISGFLFGLEFGRFIGKIFLAGDVWPTVLSVGLGLFLGIFGFALYKLGAVLIGFFLGGAISILIFLGFETEPNWWIFLVGAIPIGLLAGFFVEPYIKFASALNGAYLIMIAILSMISGEQPTLVLSGEVPWYFYLGMVALTIVGVVYQFKRYKGKDLNPKISSPDRRSNRNT